VTIDYRALAAEVRDLCRFLVDELGLDRPASHFEPALDRLWHVVHVLQPAGKIGLSSMDYTLEPALFLLAHPGVGCERGGPHSPPTVTDQRMVDRYREAARKAIKGFLLVQELYARPIG
jgi:hypothetical protein